MHDAHLARGELVLIPLRDEDHDHVLDESNLRLSKPRLIEYCAATHLDRSCDHLCDNELRPLCAVQRSAELLGDHHPGMNGRNLDDHDLLVDDRDLLNHHGYTTNDHRDHRDLLEDGHYSDGHDLPADDLLNHHGYTTNDHRDHHDLLTVDHDLLTDDRDCLMGDRDCPSHRDLQNHHGYTTNDHRDHHDLLEDGHDLLADDRDLGHHFVRMQDDLLDDYLDGMDDLHDLLTDDRDYLMGDRDCPKDGHYLDGHYLDDHYLDDHGLRLVCLNDRQLHQRHPGVRDAMACRILLPVADDVDRDFLGLALDEVYLRTTPKRRKVTECD